MDYQSTTGRSLSPLPSPSPGPDTRPNFVGIASVTFAAGVSVGRSPPFPGSSDEEADELARGNPEGHPIEGAEVSELDNEGFDREPTIRISHSASAPRNAADAAACASFARSITDVIEKKPWICPS